MMSAAGPAANLLIVIMCAIAIKIGIKTAVFLQPKYVYFTSIVDPVGGKVWEGLSVFLSMMFTLNLIMFVLNLIPLPPLDGSNIISLLLPEETARKYSTKIANPTFGFLGLIIAWQVIDPLFNLAFPWFINILYWGASFR